MSRDLGDEQEVARELAARIRKQQPVAAPVCLEESGARRVVAVMTRPYGCGLIGRARGARRRRGAVATWCSGRIGHVRATCAGREPVMATDAVDDGHREVIEVDDETTYAKSVKKRQRCKGVRIQNSDVRENL